MLWAKRFGLFSVLGFTGLFAPLHHLAQAFNGRALLLGVERGGAVYLRAARWELRCDIGNRAWLGGKKAAVRTARKASKFEGRKPA